MRSCARRASTWKSEGWKRKRDDLNEAFARYIRHGVPLVTLKSAMTLDGKIAPPPRRSREPRGRNSSGRMDHRRSCARPRAATASPERCHPGGRRNNPGGRSVAHRSQRQSAAAPVVARDSGFAPATAVGVAPGAERHALKVPGKVMCSFSVPLRRRRKEKRTGGARHSGRASSHRRSDGRPDIHAVLRRLGQLEITSVMIEGGAAVNGAALASGVVDKVFLYYAPKIMGAADRFHSLPTRLRANWMKHSVSQASPPASFRRRLRGGRILARSVRRMNRSVA